MKKILGLIITILILSACFCITAFAEKFIPGTYSASAQGNASQVSVTMTFSEAAIIDIEIDVSGETPEIGGAIGSELTAQLLAAQSAEIDGVSGATITSSAVREAAQKCINQALEPAADYTIDLPTYLVYPPTFEDISDDTMLVEYVVREYNSTNRDVHCFIERDAEGRGKKGIEILYREPSPPNIGNVFWYQDVDGKEILYDLFIYDQDLTLSPYTDARVSAQDYYSDGTLIKMFNLNGSFASASFVDKSNFNFYWQEGLQTWSYNDDQGTHYTDLGGITPNHIPSYKVNFTGETLVLWGEQESVMPTISLPSHLVLPPSIEQISDDTMLVDYKVFDDRSVEFYIDDYLVRWFYENEYETSNIGYISWRSENSESSYIYSLSIYSDDLTYYPYYQRTFGGTQGYYYWGEYEYDYEFDLDGNVVEVIYRDDGGITWYWMPEFDYGWYYFDTDNVQRYGDPGVPKRTDIIPSYKINFTGETLVLWTDTPIEEPVIPVSLFSPSKKPISEFIYTFGSFSWEDDQDNYSNFTMQLDFSDYNLFNGQDYYPGSLAVTISDGFSFRPDKIEQTKLFLSGFEKRPEILVYPIYSDTAPTKFEVSVTGDINGSASFNVVKNQTEGIVKMRPTSKVNNADTSPFWQKIELNPALDFTSPTSVFSRNLAILGCTLSQSVYNKNYYENSSTSYTYASFSNLGFSRILWQVSEDNHDVAAGFAVKKIVGEDGEIYHVILVAVRGTVGTEWIGNFNITGDDESVHSDFRECADKVLGRISSYFTALDLNTSKDNIKLFICGHSRAGAVVDLVAHDLNAYLGSNNVYAYTFAAPNSTKSPAPDDNIFNYVYKYDLVGFVPQGGYGKHGQTIVVGGSDWNDAPDEVKSAFSSYTFGKSFMHVGSKQVVISLLSADKFEMYAANTIFSTLQRSLGSAIAAPDTVKDFWLARAHGAENYCAWVINNGIKGGQTYEYFKSEMYSELNHIAQYAAGAGLVHFSTSIPALPFIARSLVKLAFKEIQLRLMDFNCPISIEVHDSDGLIVATFVNHVESVFDEENIVAYADGNSSYIAFPADRNYTLIITGEGTGYMAVETMDMDNSTGCSNLSAISKIPVSIGEKFTILSTDVDDYKPVVQSSLGFVYDSSYTGVDFVIPSSTKIISSEAFRGFAATTIIIPAATERVDSKAFSDCPNLKMIIFESGEADVAADFVQGCPTDLVIIAPEGSKVANNIELYMSYVSCPPAPVIEDRTDEVLEPTEF